MSRTLLIILLIQYIGLAIAYWLEGKTNTMVYWIGATILTSSFLMEGR